MSRSKSVTLTILLAITITGFFLRLYRLGAVPLRGDEAFSVLYWAGLPISQSLTTIATIEPHPALVYVLFRGWGLAVGSTEFAMRYLPALASLFCIPAIYAIGRKLGARDLGIVAAFLIALNPYEIWHAQDARNYGIWAGVSLIALWLGLRALNSTRRADWWLYGLVAAVAANLFYAELLTLFSFGIFVIISQRTNIKAIARWITLTTLVVGTSGISFLSLQLGLFRGGDYSGNISRQVDPLRILDTFLPALTFGTTLPTQSVNAIWPFVTLALVAGLFALWCSSRHSALFVGSISILVPLFLALISLRVSIFDPRYILSVAPAYLLSLAGLSIRFLHNRNRYVRYIGVVPVCVWVLICVFSLNNYYNDPAYTKSKDWPAVAQFLHKNVVPDDLVIQSTVDPAFGYYYHQGADRLAPDIALPANPKQPAPEIERLLESTVGNHFSLWRVGSPLPDWENTNVVETWLSSYMQPTRSEEIGDLRIRQFMPWTVSTTEISPSKLATFGSVTNLMDYRTFTELGSAITVWLYWQPIDTTQYPFKIFVHLLGANNPGIGTPLWSQDDHFPQNDRISTQNWNVGEVYRDVYRLPVSEVPPGSYSIAVGLYDPATNQRLPVGSDDNFIITNVTIQ